MTFIKKMGWTGFLVLPLFLFSVVVFFNSETRQSLREFFAPPEREILSVASGRIFPDGEGRVLKVATPQGLVLEIYGPLEDGLEPLIDRISLGDRRDAFVEVRGKATNLALKDMTGDSTFEILAPTYNASLIPHLHIFRYNLDSGKFEPHVE